MPLNLCNALEPFQRFIFLGFHWHYYGQLWSFICIIFWSSLPPWKNPRSTFGESWPIAFNFIPSHRNVNLRAQLSNSWDILSTVHGLYWLALPRMRIIISLVLLTSTTNSPITSLARWLLWSNSLVPTLPSSLHPKPSPLSTSSNSCLPHLHLTLTFVLEVDATEKTGVVVLSQWFGPKIHLHPITFFSQKMTSAEKSNYINDRWHYLLEGFAHPTLIFSGQRNLEF